MELKLDKPKDLVDPCPACLPYITHDDMACDRCDKKLLKTDYWDKLSHLRITLDPSKTYIIIAGKPYSVASPVCLKDVKGVEHWVQMTTNLSRFVEVK